MTYRITGLDPAPFAPLFDQTDQQLRDRHIFRMAVTAPWGFPCRVTLDDAEPGPFVLLVNHCSVPHGPYRARHAIFVTQGALAPATLRDSIPPALDSRILSLRASDRDWLMVNATLVQPGQGDRAVRELFTNPAPAYIHAHNATRGCFAAAIERDP